MGKGKKKAKNNNLKLALQSQKKKWFQSRDMEKLFSEAREIIKEKEKKWHSWYSRIFYKRWAKENKKKENEPKRESTLNSYEIFKTKFHNYIFDFFDIKDLIELLVMNSKENLKSKAKELNEVIESNIIAKNDNMAISYFEKNDYEKWRTLQNDVFLLGTSWEKIYKNFFIYIITIYENFFQDMMRFILKTYPWKLSNQWKLSKEKSLSYDDFKKYSSIEDIQNFYIEANISTNMEWDTIEKFKKFDWLLDNNNDFKLINVIPLKDLIEINSRRNLYVHNDWIINNKYIEKCKSWWVSVKDINIGEKLTINKEYFLKSFYTIVETVLKTSYVVFCKCFHNKKEIDNFDDNFNSLIVDYLIPKFDKEKVDLSSNVLEFLYSYIDDKSEHDDIIKQLFIINFALCNKIQWNKEKCKKILTLRNWSKTTPNFQLANFVLTEDRKQASELMEICSCIKKVNNKFSRKDYQTLPLFFEFKKTEEFKEKYKKIYWFDFYEEDNFIQDVSSIE